MRLLRVIPLLVFALLIAGLTVTAVLAQSPCSHVLFRIDSETPVDRQAICDAALPWRDEGIQVYVYLTDAVPVDEAAWFDLLDQVEIEAGLRTPGASGGFDRNGLAFEASARSGVPWTNTITYGEELFDSSLDNEQALDQVKDILNQGLQNGDATAAFVDAVTTAYEVTNPPPSRASLGVGAIAVLGLGGGLAYVFVARPALQRRRREQELTEHLGTVQQNVANLLLAAERLLDGDKPQDTVLYQLYEANGGTHDPERTAQVTEWIRRSQAALRDAFDLRRDLLATDVADATGLEQQVRNWEMIYLTLVGSNPRVTNLTENQLKDLLNPLVVLEREAVDVQLAEQLDAIRREIAGMPLKVDLLEVDPATVDQEGILGYVDMTEQVIQELMDAQRDAPVALAEAQDKLAQTEEAADQASPFGLTRNETLAGIASRLAEAEELLGRGNALAALALVNRARRDLEIVEDLLAAESDHEARLAAIAEVTGAGYRPAQLAAQESELDADIEHIVAAIRAGDYLAADTWIDELDADGERAVEHAHNWRERQQFNTESLRLLTGRLEDTAVLEADAQTAWEQLQQYPASNWQDIAPGLPAITETLAKLRSENLPAIAAMNDLQTQDVPGAEDLLAETGQQVLQAERQLQALTNRIAEVRAAEQNLPQGLQQAAVEFGEARAFRDREDPKIGPDVDDLLVEARSLLERATAEYETRAFFPAMNDQLQSREKSAAALASARQQVATIERLERELLDAKGDAETAVRRANAAANAQPSVAHTTASSAKLAEANAAFSQARQREAVTMPLEDQALQEGLLASAMLYKAAAEIARAAEEQIERENEEHKALYESAAAAVVAARGAIKRAEGYVRDRDARGEGKEALQRALRTLPDDVALTASKEQLMALREQARLAKTYAEEAERKARIAISYRSPQPAIPFPIPSGSMGRTPGGSVIIGGRPRTSNRSMQRRSSTSAPSMARRSSSFGGSGRSSSSGSSRRSSGGGSRRR